MTIAVIVVFLVAVAHATEGSFAPASGTAPGSSVGGSYNPVGTVVDNSCLRPDTKGKFPSCNPKKAQCCLGLKCIKFPDGKHRCGGEYSTPYMTSATKTTTAVDENLIESKAHEVTKDKKSVPGEKPAGYLPFDWGGMMPGGSEKNGKGIDGGQFGPQGPNGGKFSPTGDDTVVDPVHSKQTTVAFSASGSSESQSLSTWLASLEDALGLSTSPTIETLKSKVSRQSDKHHAPYNPQTYSIRKPSSNSTTPWTLSIGTWVLFSGLCTTMLALRWKSRQGRFRVRRLNTDRSPVMIRTTYESV